MELDFVYKNEIQQLLDRLNRLVDDIPSEILSDKNTMCYWNIRFNGAVINSGYGIGTIALIGIMDAISFIIPRFVQSSQVQIELLPGGVREYKPSEK